MRRWLWLGVTALLLMPASVALAHVDNVRDDFGSVSYEGSDGSLPWGSSWQEIGESDGPESGQLKVVSEDCSNNNCLQITGVLLNVYGVNRKADLSTFATASLSFDLRAEVPLLSRGALSVLVRGNGSGWDTLATYTVDSTAGTTTEELDVTEFAGPDFELRFRLSTSVLGVLGGPAVYLDKVNIEGQAIATTTTTSTTSTSAPTTTSTSVPTTTDSPNTTGASSVPTTTSDTAGQDDPSGGGGTSTTTTTRSHRADVGGAEETTTTTSGTTSTTDSVGSSVGVAHDDQRPGRDGSLREAGLVIGADYRPATMGDLPGVDVEVLAAELKGDFSLAVEALSAAKLWLGILVLVVTTAIVSGADSRRSRRPG